MVRTRTTIVLMGVLAGISPVRAASLSVGSIAMPPNSITTFTVSGVISSESTYGVSILVELVPLGGAVGTVVFTAAPPTDISQVGDPWPGTGTFSAYDVDLTGNLLHNGTVDDNGTFLPAPVTFNGTLSRFPVQSSAAANGVWVILLSTSAGASGWEGLTTTLNAGTITVTASACLMDADCNDGNVCTTDLCNAGSCTYTNNTVSCSDGDLCTASDICAGGVCAGTPVNCSGMTDSCNVGTCNPGSGACEAIPTNEGATCSDGLLCTTGDICGGGICAGTPVNCSTLSDQCNLGVCNPSTGLCEAQPANKGGPCNDGDLCTVSDVCMSGTCAGTAVDCSGLNNACNIGICNTANGMCQAQPANQGGPCNDGSLCTDNDSCSAGVCAGTPVNCSALNNTCNVGVCNLGTGMCQAQPANQGGICNDNNTCTSGDVCMSGVCAGSPVAGCDPCVTAGDCNDGNVCTTDTCHPAGVCIYTDNTAPCNDFVFCTLNDVCSAGSCVGTGNTCPGQLCDEAGDVCVDCLIHADCDDANVCTTDVCVGGACQNNPNTLPCNDGLFCTAMDTCSGGTCVGSGDPCSGGLLCDEATNSCVECLVHSDCDDTNPCTTDTCTLGVCANNNNTLPCNDGLFCTANDVCGSGLCNGSGDPCPGQLCSEKLNACVECLSAADCNDGNVCTDDACSAGNCVYTDNTVSCDDFLFCTVSDVCSAGACLGSGDPCLTPLLCDEATDGCVECLVHLDCDDDNPCTDDVCTAGICANNDNVSPCSDGLFCTATDFCTGGNCVGSGNPCMLPLLCNETTNTCVECLVNADCNDSNECTTDSCVAGSCDFTPNALPCTDGSFCSAVDVCSGGSCVGSGNPCTLPLLCDESADACVACLSGADCADGNLCTNDNCTGGVCTNPNNTVPCDDGQFCTSLDLCSGGACTGSVDPCSPPELCDENLNACVDCLVHADCDDSNPCTDDVCTAGVCSNPNNTAPCNDGLFCTLTDVCSGGACVGSGIQCPGLFCDEAGDACVACLVDANCNDANPCTDDTCVSGSCVATPNVAPCNDGLFCTAADVCSGGVCVGSGEPCTPPLLCNETTNTCVNCLTAADCDDSNVCTDDACTAGVCGYVNNADPCDDGLFCTATDTCGGGLCVGVGDPCTPPDLCDESMNACVECLTAADCDDANVCTTDGCIAGVCGYTFNVLPCDDGLFCTASDLCAGGVCVGGGTPCPGQLCHEGTDACVNCLNDTDCNDGNLCTNDTCVGGSCVFTPNMVMCNDGNICSISDRCTDGVCAGTAVDCSAMDTGCMTGTCNPTSGICEAVNSNEGGSCDDGDLCTTGDVCQAGACMATTVDCSGLNSFCRIGNCNPATGMCEGTPTNTGLACNDGNICTSADACTAGFCIGNLVPSCDPCTTAADCNDTNECTSDFCHPVGVCYHGNVAGSCDDANPCTANDSCSSGVCVGGGIGGCIQCSVPSDCNDSNPCTDDSCVAGVCQHSPHNGVACDDGNICTSTDTCSGGACAGAPIVGCDICAVHADCNDGNPCTTDSCHPLGICIYANNTLPCNDGVPCTQNDLCNNGSCAGIATPDGGACDDGSNCTAFDQCFGGLCNGTPTNEGLACNDGNLCTLTDSCQSGVCAGVPIDCSPLNNTCNVGICNLTTGSCESAATNEGGVCDDGVPCTMGDACTAGTCGGSPVDCSPLTGFCSIGSCNATTGMCEALPRNEGLPCDDQSVCTINDACLNGVCTGPGPDCSAFDSSCTVGTCHPVNGNCQASPANEGGLCDDGQLCTQTDLCAAGICAGTPVDCSAFDTACLSSTCNPTTGSCESTPVNEGGPCNDGNLCTQGDQCAAGVCAGMPTDCSGLNSGCLVGTCNPIDGTCMQVPAGEGGACDDGLLCTQNDVCSGGVCSGTPTNCSSLSTTCTLGVCNTGTGMCQALPTNQGGSCNDNNRCTLDDRCNAGTCVGTPKNCSAFTNVCNVGSCNTVSGACYAAPANEGGPCNDGFACTINDQCSSGTCAGTPTQPVVVDLIWSPSAQSATVGSTVQVELVARSATCFPQQVGSVQAILNWNPAVLKLLGHVDTGPYEWNSSEFPNDSALDGLNAPFTDPPGNDGTALYLALASFVQGATVPPSGLVVTTFEFQALATTPGTPISIPAATGSFTFSQVLSEGIDTDVTGSLGGASVTIVQCLSKGDCNDGNVCTTDHCIAGSCSHVNNALPCNDGLFCTPTDVCSAGVCLGSGIRCGAGLFCDEGTDACVQCLQHSHCNDGNLCTTDTCNSGTCGFSFNTLSCDDGQFCTPTDTCTAGVCLGSGVRCPGEFCNETTDQCVECLSSANCNDGNLCTTDACLSGNCVHNANSLACNDGQFCTVNDFCTAGVCVGSTNPCAPPLLCNEATDVCVECIGNADCADGNLCTDDICLSGTCFNPNNNEFCEDGLFCTAGDRCFGGVCTAGTGVACPGLQCDEANNTCVECFTVADCNDGIACTTDLCASGICGHVPNHASCNDGLFCSGTEICAVGTGCVSSGSPCDSPALCEEATDTCRCGAPSVSPEGPRHISVVASPGVTPLALRVQSTDPDLDCLPKYVAANGSLVDAPVFRTPAAWGTVHLSDARIEPATAYSIQSDCRTMPTNPENLSPAVFVLTYLWGDIDNSGLVDVDDIVLVLNCFVVVFDHDADIAPCQSDNLCDVDDITAILGAFVGQGYSCPEPCP